MSKMHQKISIALCTYNGENYLTEQLDSIKSQTTPADEIILCDDNSDDQTLSIANAFKNQGLPIKIHKNNQTLGFIENFSQAIHRCTGDIIFLCDQDDIWHPEKISHMIIAFEKSADTLLIFSNGDLVSSTAQPLNCSLWEALPTFPVSNPTFHNLLNNDWITGAACAFRKDLVKYALPFPPYWVHDAWLGLIASAYGKVQSIPDMLIAYRQHENNQIGLKPPKLKQKLKKAMRLMRTPHIDTPMKYQPLQHRLPIEHPAQKILVGKLRHLENRQLPIRQRGLGILKEIFNGGYWHYAKGGESIIRDIGLFIYQIMYDIRPTSDSK